jgi:type IV fimbrial biogenesis protein FimT
MTPKVSQSRNILAFRHRMPRRAPGFTIIELLVVMFLVAILSAIAVPSFKSMMASSRLTTQANEFIAALNYGRSASITRNTTMTFCRVAAAADVTCAGAAGNWQFWIIRNAAGEIVRSGSVPTYGTALRATSSLPADSVLFNSDGLSRTTAGALVNNEAITICTNPGMGENNRLVTLGAGSRIFTTKTTTAGC